MSISKYKRKSTSIALATSLIIFSGFSQSADLYQVVDLGEIGEVTNEAIQRSAEAFAINDLDNAVGNASGETFASHAFVYQNGSMTDLGHLDRFILTVESPTVAVEGAGISAAFGVNNQYAVGYSIESEVTQGTADDGSFFDIITDREFAVYYDIASLTVNSIPQFVPATPLNAKAVSINDNNLIVGFGLFDPEDGNDDNGDPLTTPYRRGFFYDVDADLLTMVNPFDGLDSQRNISLRAVNDSGLAVGVSEQLVDDILSFEVVIVDETSPETIEKVDIFGGITQQPWAINNSGKFVGLARTGANSTTLEAFVYDTNLNTATGLGFLNDNFKDSEAFDINESDQIVGVSQVLNGPIYHAFLYENDTLKDLNKHISCDDASAWQLTEARSINDSGVITGTGILAGEKRAFMLMPIAASAPNCEPVTSSDSGSVPVIGMLFLTVITWIRRKNNER